MSGVLALAAALGSTGSAGLAGCATSGVDNEHGPDYAGDASEAGDAAAPDTGLEHDAAAVDSSGDDAPVQNDAQDASGAIDAPAEAPVEASLDAGAACTSTMALLAGGPSSIAQASGPSTPCVSRRSGYTTCSMSSAKPNSTRAGSSRTPSG